MWEIPDPPFRDPDDDYPLLCAMCGAGTYDDNADGLCGECYPLLSAARYEQEQREGQDEAEIAGE